MLWISLILAAAMTFLIVRTPTAVARHGLNDLCERSISGAAVVGYGISSIAMHQQGAEQNVVAAGQAVSIVTLWIMAATLRYQGRDFMLYTLTISLMTMISMSYFSFSNNFLDMPEELAVAMGVGCTVLCAAILLLFTLFRQLFPHKRRR